MTASSSGPHTAMHQARKVTAVAPRAHLYLFNVCITATQIQNQGRTDSAKSAQAPHLFESTRACVQCKLKEVSSAAEEKETKTSSGAHLQHHLFCTEEVGACLEHKRAEQQAFRMA
jgi:hypothetical protein